MIADLSLREAVGRLMIVGYEGHDFSEVARLLEEVRPLGFIFFTRNFPSHDPDKLPQLIRQSQEMAQSILGRPLLWMIDYEGGLVQRLPSPPFTRVPAAKEMTAKDPIMVKATVNTASLELASLGFNFNLAPILDVASPDSDFIGSRSFSAKSSEVSFWGRLYAETYQDAGLLCAGKHFPGLGRATLDPHAVLPTIDFPKEILMADLLPFFELMDVLPAIMSTHALYPAFDRDFPATFSAKIINILRREKAYQGAIISDDLEMGAVVKNYPMGEAATLAVAAGHDLLLICRRREYVLECQKALGSACKSGKITDKRLLEAHGQGQALLSALKSVTVKV